MTYRRSTARPRRPPRRRRSRKARRNAGDSPTPLQSKVTRLEKELKALREKKKAASTAEEAEALSSQISDKLLSLNTISKRLKRLAKSARESKLVREIGLDPVIDISPQLYDAVLAGTKTLITVTAPVAEEIGIESDETARSALKVPVNVKQPDKERPIKKVWATRRGPLATGSEIIAGSGGWDAFQAKDQEHTDRAAVEALADASVYEISLTRPPDGPGRKIRPTGPLLAACSSNSRAPDLFILPVSPPMARRYLSATLLHLADRPEVSAVIEKSTSFQAAQRDLRKFTINMSGVTRTLVLPWRYAKELALLNLDSAAGPWAEVKKGHALPGADRPSGKDKGINFGIFSAYLGAPGTELSFASAFGGKNTTVPWAAQSLAALLEQWELAQEGGVRRDEQPTFFTSLRGVKGPAGKNPLALVVAGPRGTEEGYKISGGNPRVPISKDMVALAKAMTWGNKDRVAYSLCFLLPPIIVKGRRKKTELTGVRSYEHALLHSEYSPLRHYSSLIPDFPPLRGYRANDSAKRVNRLARAGEEIEFGQEIPFGSREAYFGEMAQIQNWPGRYTELLHFAFGQDMNRADFTSWLAVNEHTLENYRELAEDIELEEAYQVYGEGRYQLEQKLMSRERRRPLRLSDLVPHELALITFAQMVAGPHQRLVVPARIVIRDDEGSERVVYDLPNPEGVTTWEHEEPVLLKKMVDGKIVQVWSKEEKVYTLARLHELLWKQHPGRYIPPMVGKVALIHTRQAIEEVAKLEETEDTPDTSPGAVRALLHRKGHPIGESRRWYLILPPLTYYSVVMRKRVIVRDGVEELFEYPGIDDRYFPYMGLPKMVRLISRDLMRIDLGGSRGFPTLVPVPSGRGDKWPPWSSARAPYLLSKLPVYLLDEDAEKMMGPAEEGPAGENYLQTFGRIFGMTRRSAAVKGGIEAALAGQEAPGKRAKRGRAQEATAVPIRGDAMIKGFFPLVIKTAKMLGRGSVESKGDAMIKLYDALGQFWGPVLDTMNRVREAEKRKPLPLDTPAPIPVRYGGDDESHSKALEAEALTTLFALLDPESEGFRLFFAEEPLIHPDFHPITGEGRVDSSRLFAADVNEEVTSLDNPRRGRRKKRKARRRRRSRSAHRNPLDEAQWKAVEGWVEGRLTEPPSEPGTFHGPAGNEELFEAVRAIYPRRASRKGLGSVERLSALTHLDLFPAAHTGEVSSREEEAIRRKMLSGIVSDPGRAPEEEDLDEGDLTYLARHSALPLTVGRQILDLRRMSKGKSRFVSATGALCRLSHNTSRLKGYQPLLPATTPGQAWILVGPPVVEGGAQRVMSYRNGFHVDCDMLVNENQTPLSVALGRAIQEMVLWLAEKNGIRARRIEGLYLGLIGSPFVRRLWGPGNRLDASVMLRKAYTEPPVNILLPRYAPGSTAKEASDPSFNLVQSRKAALDDLRAYSRAQRKAPPALSRIPFRRAAEAPTPAEPEYETEFEQEEAEAPPE